MSMPAALACACIRRPASTAPEKAASDVEKSTFKRLEAGLLQMELRLVRIIAVDRLRIGGEFDRRRDRIVIARRAIAQQDLVDEILAVDRPFERQSDIDIVEGRHA